MYSYSEHQMLVWSRLKKCCCMSQIKLVLLCPLLVKYKTTLLLYPTHE